MTLAHTLLFLLALALAPTSVAAEVPTTGPGNAVEPSELVIPSGRHLDSAAAEQHGAGSPVTPARSELPICTPAQALKQILAGAAKLLLCRASNANCPGQGFEQTPECVLAKGKF